MDHIKIRYRNGTWEYLSIGLWAKMKPYIGLEGGFRVWLKIEVK